MAKRKPMPWIQWGTYGKRCKSAINLGDKEDNYLDRISQLPNELLIAILSLLNIGEAVTTCVLSKRWRYLWTHVSCINFDDLDAFPKGRRRRRRQSETTETRFDCVNRVLLLHRGSTLDKFRIRSSVLDSNYAFEIDNWIEFAMQKKRVQRLEIELERHRHHVYTSTRYTFPEKPFKSPFGVSSFTSLTHLSLTFVNMTGEVVEHLLSKCQLLEHLCVFGSKHLVNLTVAGSSLPLKFLQISKCYGLNKVEIFAPNLVSFIYDGVGSYQRGIVLKHAPSLVKVSLAESIGCTTRPFYSISSYCPQLVTLSLHMNLIWGTIGKLPEFPELTCLKDLSLSVVASDETSLLDLTILIEQSPFLQRFTLKLTWQPELEQLSRNMREINKRPHQCLKVVKLSGFVGSAIDTELAMYLIENAIVLEKIIFDTVKVIECPTIISEFLHFGAIRNRALQLGTELLRPGAELII